MSWRDCKHSMVYFGGMASCTKCAAELLPNGKLRAPSASSRMHSAKAKAAFAKKRKKR